MEIQLFTMPLCPHPEQLEELNNFLRSHKVVDIRKEIAMVNGNSVWTFCITYLRSSSLVGNLTKTTKVDYREVLDENAFKRFSVLRKIRKVLADEEAIPAYAVFTDAELAEMARQENLSSETMQAIQGIGKKKMDKYADRMIMEFNKQKNETSGTSN